MEATVTTGNNGGRKKAAMALFSCIAVIGMIAVYLYVQYKKTHITTDDAFIEGNIHTIASKVPGTVKSVYIESNQFVKKGELLLEIDASDLDVKVSEASSALNAEKSRTAESDSRLEAAKKQLEEAMAKADETKAIKELQVANYEQADRDRERAENLQKKGAITRERYEKALTAYKVAEAQVKASEEGRKSHMAAIETRKALIRQAEASMAAQLSSIRQKEAALEIAKLNAGYTKIYAPTDGYITKKSVEIGNQLQPGQPLMAIVPLDGVYVIANFKETQMGRIRPGQKVEIKVDSYPGRKITGKVESIMAGTGSAFSLFPSENATGNFVKVVQRIPVKIILDKDADREHVLRVGMSVVPTVVTGK